MFGHIIVAAGTQATHALGCPSAHKRFAAPQQLSYRAYCGRLQWDDRLTDVAEVAPFTSQASRTWRGLVSQHGSQSDPLASVPHVVTAPKAQRAAWLLLVAQYQPHMACFTSCSLPRPRVSQV